jgi:hypothetical protein
MSFEKTGEHRCPKIGEWFMNSRGVPKKSSMDFYVFTFDILREVKDTVMISENSTKTEILAAYNQLRADVVEKARELTDQHGWCDEVNTALAELGLVSGTKIMLTFEVVLPPTSTDRDSLISDAHDKIIDACYDCLLVVNGVCEYHRDTEDFDFRNVSLVSSQIESG